MSAIAVLPFALVAGYEPRSIPSEAPAVTADWEDRFSRSATMGSSARVMPMFFSSPSLRSLKSPALARSRPVEDVSKAISQQGPLDILVVNAGFGAAGDPLEQDPDLVDHTIDVNIRGPYHAAVEAARQMPNGGRIVIMGSINGDRVPFPRAAAYAMTKSAVQGMVRGLARDFGDREITVNGVQPGPVDTDSNPADGPKAGDMHSVMAIKRHALPEEIAGLVSYLVGPEAAFLPGLSTRSTVDSEPEDDTKQRLPKQGLGAA